MTQRNGRPRGFRRKLPAGRRVTCNFCLQQTVQGASRVMSSLLFFFCPSCWRNREACEEHMRRAARVDGSTSKR